MNLINLIKAEVVMFKGELKSYSLNYIFYNIGLLFLFIGLFYSVDSSEIGTRASLLYGLITWQLSISSLTYISEVIEDEALTGTLEQLFLTRTSETGVFLVKILISSAFAIVKSAVLFLICVTAFNMWGDLINLKGLNLLFLVLIIINMLSFGVMGLAFGGISLYKKKTQSFLNMISYALLFFSNTTVKTTSLPAVVRGFSYMIPLTWFNKYVDEIINTNSYLNENLMYFIALSVVYMLLGYFVFVKLLNKAKEDGKLGQY